MQQRSTPLRWRWVAGVGNAADPMAGFGMQQARRLECGASRRGGERPRGRNEIWRLAPSGRRKAATSAGSGRTQERWQRGVQGEAQERRAGNGPARKGSLWRRVKVTQAADLEREQLCLHSCRRCRRSPGEAVDGKASEVSSETGQDQGGSGKGQRPATRRTQTNDEDLETGRHRSAAWKSPQTPREARPR